MDRDRVKLTTAAPHSASGWALTVGEGRATGKLWLSTPQHRFCRYSPPGHLHARERGTGARPLGKIFQILELSDLGSRQAAGQLAGQFAQPKQVMNSQRSMRRQSRCR